MAKFTLFLDPGHGGQDPGAVGNGLQEKAIVLNVCHRIKHYLSAHYPDIACVLSREDDTFIPLRERTDRANRMGADALVSVHVNSAADHRANGFESFIYTTDDSSSRSYALQQHLHGTLADLWASADRRDRGQKKANFHMVREFKGAAVLLELGFIVNAQDAKLLQDPAFLQAHAERIGDAVAAYAGMSKRQPADKVYRIIVDGQQTGAFAVTDNVVRAFKQAIQSGARKIEAELVK